jgi:indolepyruvate ferredoxin oxidoreductase beta subunit
MNKKVYIETYGCQMNVNDSEVVLSILQGEGYSLTENIEEADLILAFEPGEAVRMLPFLKKDGFVITNTRAVKPTTATLTGSGYDAGPMLEYLHKKVADGHLMMVDGDSAAAALGNPRVLNVVLLGAAVRTGALGLTEEDILNVMGKVIKEKFLDLNRKAFTLA